MGEDTLLRPGFIATGVLNNTVDTRFRAINDSWPVFAFAHDLGVVTATQTSPVVYTIGHVRDPLVQLLNIPNTNTLRGSYYFTRYSSVDNMVLLPFTPCVSSMLMLSSQVTAILDDYPNTLARAINFDTNLTSAAFDITPQDPNYANILALSVRQVFGNIELTAGWNGANYVSTDIMAFVRGAYFLFTNVSIANSLSDRWGTIF